MKNILLTLTCILLSNVIYSRSPQLFTISSGTEKQNHKSLAIEKIASSDYFDFYTTLEDGETYWSEISATIDDWYLELCSYWDRPGLTPIFDPDNKTSIYLLDNASFISESGGELPAWKCGNIKNSNTIITRLPSSENSMYENSYPNLVKNIMGQFILKKHLNEYGDDYFLEGFGLFYSGYSPKRDSILQAVSHLGQKPSLNVLYDTDNLPYSYKKDLLTSYIESQVLSVTGVQALSPNNYVEHWYAHLEYYYSKAEDERIKLLKQTERFNIYAAESDLSHIDEIANKLEQRIALYETLFEFPIKHRFYCVVYPTIQARGDCLIFSSGNGGSGWSGDKLDITSKNEGWSDEDFYGFLIPHELFHVYHFNLVEHLFSIPAFYSEGLANYISGYEDEGYLDGTEYLIYKINSAFYHYTTNYNMEPGMEQIMDSQADENFDNYYNDPYYFGELFFKYFMEREGDFGDLRIFFNSNLDYSKIGKSYNEIDKGYISFLKEYARFTPSAELVEIPFQEPFDNFNNGWGKPSYHNPDNWQLTDRSANDNCARFYTYSDKNLPIESWLISPPLDAKDMDEVKLSFDFARYGEGIDLDLFYTNNFEEFTDSTNWTSLKSVEMPADWGWSNTGEITINNPSDTLYIGLRQKSTGEQHLQLYIDNFNVTGIKTGSKIISEAVQSLKVFPNPVTNTSVISFQTKTSGNVDLSIFDIQGKKINTVIHANLPAGNHRIPLENSMTESGIYIAKLITEQGVSSIRIIKNN